MKFLPQEIMDLIVEYSIEKTKSKSDKPHEFLILHYNINPWRIVSRDFLNEYDTNPPPEMLQIPTCLIT